MIPANKSAWADSFIYFWVQRSLRRSFYRIRARGLSHWRGLETARPALTISNHTNWWDAWLVHRLTRECPHKKIFGMMEEANLRPNRFLTRIGAFGVDLQTPRGAFAGTRYARHLLQDASHLVWLFPQGKMTRAGAALELKDGAEHLAQHTPGVQVIPVYFHYAFGKESRPEIFIEIGEPLPPEAHSTEAFGLALTVLSERLTCSLSEENFSGFENLQPPQWTINKRWEYVQRLMTGRLSGFQSKN
jgi:1-acyl-sn-glycerol-3-phosphate acyltransferase